MVNSSVVMLLSNNVIKLVFEEVVKKRSVLFKELRQSLGKAAEFPEGAEKSQIENAVQVLKEADLIKERTSPIKDFNTYYVTADGLTAERQLRLAEPA